MGTIIIRFHKGIKNSDIVLYSVQKRERECVYVYESVNRKKTEELRQNKGVLEHRNLKSPCVIVYTANMLSNITIEHPNPIFQFFLWPMYAPFWDTVAVADVEEFAEDVVPADLTCVATPSAEVDGAVDTSKVELLTDGEATSVLGV